MTTAGPETEAGKKKSYSVNLSATVVIGGTVIPLTTKEIDFSHTLTDAKTSAKKGLAFGMPKDVTVSTTLAHLTAWIQKSVSDFEMPPITNDALNGKGSDTYGDVVVTITSLNINTAGHFDISILVDFETGLDDLLDLSDFKSVFDVQKIGFAFSYDKPQQQ